MEETVKTEPGNELQPGLAKRKIYLIVTTTDPEEMEITVTKNLLDGYKMHGPMFVKEDKFCQPMVDEDLLENYKQMGVK